MGNVQTSGSFIYPQGRAKIKSERSSRDKWRTGPLGFFTAFNPRDIMSVFITVQVRRWGSASCLESMKPYPTCKTQFSQIPSTLTSSLSCHSILSPGKSSRHLQHHLQHFGQLLQNEPEDAGTGTLIIAPPFNWFLPP